MKATSKRGRRPHDDVLTKTEWAIVHAVQHGMTTREIAKRRGVSFDAVKFHIDNAKAKLGLPNRQALRRWFQSPKDSALSGQTHKQQDRFTIGQIARTVKDIQASETWYRDVLKLPHLFTFGNMAFFDCNGTRLLLSQVEAELQQESIIYFQVVDILTTYDQLRERNIEFINPPHMIHRHADGSEEWMAFFKDLEGRTLAIMSRVPRST